MEKEKITLLSISVIFFSAIIFLPHIAQATTFDLKYGDPNRVCSGIVGGQLVSGNICVTRDFTFHTGDILQIDKGVTILGYTIINHGTILSYGEIDTLTNLNNYGNIASNGDFRIHGQMENTGILDIGIAGTFENIGITNNYGTIFNMNHIVNKDIIKNSKTINDWCRATYYGPPPIGNPVIHSPCVPVLSNPIP